MEIELLHFYICDSLFLYKSVPITITKAVLFSLLTIGTKLFWLVFLLIYFTECIIFSSVMLPPWWSLHFSLLIVEHFNFNMIYLCNFYAYWINSWMRTLTVLFVPVCRRIRSLRYFYFLWCVTLMRTHNMKEESNLQVNFKRENESGNRNLFYLLHEYLLSIPYD